jgi:hypothetical protein
MSFIPSKAPDVKGEISSDQALTGEEQPDPIAEAAASCSEPSTIGDLTTEPNAEEWVKFWMWSFGGFTADMVPLIPVGAKLSPTSSVEPAMVGKVPGRLKDDGTWIGFTGFTQHYATDEDIAAWSVWRGAGIGLIGRNYPAVDIDVTDASLADKVQALAIEKLGSAPCRIGNAPKRLLMYRGKLAKKLRLVLTRGDEMQAVECLGARGHYVVAGVHPKTGNPYAWDTDPAAGFPFAEVDEGGLVSFLDEVAGLAAVDAWEVKTTSKGSSHSDNCHGDHRYECAPAPEGFKPDTPRIIARAVSMLQGAEPAIEGKGGDCHTMGLARLLGDYGVTEPTAFELMLAHWNQRCAPPWGEATLKGKIYRAYRSRQNELGSHAIPDGFPLPWLDMIARAAEPTADWGEPVDILGSRPPTLPALSRSMLPSVIADYAFDQAELMGADPGFVAMPLLAVCAAALHDDVKIQPKVHDDSWTESARLWVLICGDVASKKTPAMSAAKRPWEQIETEWRNQHTADMMKWKEAERIRKNTIEFVNRQHKAHGPHNPDASTPVPPETDRPVLRRKIVNDTTVEGLCKILAANTGGILIEADEVMGWLCSFDMYRSQGGGRDRAFWLQAYEGKAYSKDRASDDGSLFVPNLSASVVGGIQPGKLREVAKDLQTDGFIQRAVVISAAGPPTRGVDRISDRAAQERVERMLRRIQSYGKGVPVRIEAQECRRKIDEIAEAMATLPTTPEAFKAHLGKWSGLFVRLLLTFHAVECADRDETLAPVVAAETAERACAFTLGYLLPQQEHFYLTYFHGASRLDADLLWLAGYILAHKSERVTLREIKRAYHVEDEQRIKGAMEALASCNWVGAENFDRSLNGSKWWQVNPAVHTRFAALAKAEAARRQEIKRRIADAGERVGLWRLGTIGTFARG